jgi:hypothetical protein
MKPPRIKDFFGGGEAEAWKAGKTVADWTRDCLLRQLQAGPKQGMDLHFFTELGVQLLLMNTLGWTGLLHRRYRLGSALSVGIGGAHQSPRLRG